MGSNMNEISVTADLETRDHDEKWLCVRIVRNQSDATITDVGFLGSNAQRHLLDSFPWTDSGPGTRRPGKIWPYIPDPLYPELCVATTIEAFQGRAGNEVGSPVPNMLSLFVQDTDGRRYYARDIALDSGEKGKRRYMEFWTAGELKKLIALHASEARRRGGRVYSLVYYGTQQEHGGPLDGLVLHLHKDGPGGPHGPDISFIHAEGAKLREAGQQLLEQYALQDYLCGVARLDFHRIVEDYQTETAKDDPTGMNWLKWIKLIGFVVGFIGAVIAIVNSACG